MEKEYWYLVTFISTEKNGTVNAASCTLQTDYRMEDRLRTKGGLTSLSDDLARNLNVESTTILNFKEI